MGFQSFEDIQSWQEARHVSNCIGEVCMRSHVKKDWAWVNQISRASLSVMSNIAEGNDALTNPEFVKFLGYAKRSAAEVRSQLYYGLDRDYISQYEFNSWSEKLKSIGGKLAKLIQYLKCHEEQASSDAKHSTFNIQLSTLSWEEEKSQIFSTLSCN